MISLVFCVSYLILEFYVNTEHNTDWPIRIRVEVG